MYQATRIVSNKKHPSLPLAEVVVEFSDGVNTYQKTFNVDVPESLDFLIKNEILNQEKISNFVSSFPDGTTDLNNIKPVPPTKKEQAKKDYEEAVRKLGTLKTELDLGIFDSSDKMFSDALLDAKNKRDIWLNLP